MCTSIIQEEPKWTEMEQDTGSSNGKGIGPSLGSIKIKLSKAP